MAECGAICRHIKEKIADITYFTSRNTKRYGVGNFRGPRSAISGREQSQQNPLYSITSSASESRLSEILMPSASAVLRLITVSNLVGCSTGRSAGFAPLRIFAV